MPTARVTLTIELDAGSNWTKDTTMDQIYKQASTETVNRVKNALAKELYHDKVRFIGEPKVVAVYNTMDTKP